MGELALSKGLKRFQLLLPPNKATSNLVALNNYFMIAHSLCLSEIQEEHGQRPGLRIGW